MTSINLYEAYAAVYDKSLREKSEESTLSFIDELTDDELEEVVEEVVYELIDEGYEFNEVQDIFEEVIGEDLEILEEIELVSEYLYECGLNEYGSATVLNDPNYFDILESLFDSEELTEARAARKRTGGKSVEQIKAEIDAREAAKKAAKKPKAPSVQIKVNKVKVSQPATTSVSASDTKDNIKDKTATSAYLEKRRAEKAAEKSKTSAAAEGEKIAKGRARNIRNIRMGKAVRKGIESAKSVTKKVGKTLASPARGGAGGGTSVAGRVGQASAAASRGAEEVKSNVKRGLKSLIRKGAEKVAGAAGRVAKGATGVATRMQEETDLFDTILEYLISEGYADTDEAALVIMANMSEEWRESIVEGGYNDFFRGQKKTKGAKPERYGSDREGNPTGKYLQMKHEKKAAQREKDADEQKRRDSAAMSRGTWDKD